MLVQLEFLTQREVSMSIDIQNLKTEIANRKKMSDSRNMPYNKEADSSLMETSWQNLDCIPEQDLYRFARENSKGPEEYLEIILQEETDPTPFCSTPGMNPRNKSATVCAVESLDYSSTATTSYAGVAITSTVHKTVGISPDKTATNALSAIEIKSSMPDNVTDATADVIVATPVRLNFNVSLCLFFLFS